MWPSIQLGSEMDTVSYTHLDVYKRQIRNLLVANDRYTKPMMTVFLILTIVAGVLANTRGLVGLLPVFATVEYTICCHYIVGEKATKCSI